MEITPFIPRILRVRERLLISNLKRSDLGVWNLANEVATLRQVGARNDNHPPVVASPDSAEAIPEGEILNPKHEILNKR